MALENWMGESFIQAPAAALLQRVAASADLLDSDRDIATAFLSQGYQPQSGEFTGMLEQMHDTAPAEFSKTTKQ